MTDVGFPAVCDTNFVLDYFRTTADDRMLYGGRVSYSTVTPKNLAQSMRQRMVRSFPQLRDVPMHRRRRVRHPVPVRRLRR